MKGISKKFLSIILAAILMMSASAVGATAYEDYEDEYYEDEFYDDGYYEDDYYYDSVLQDGIWYDLVITEDFASATVSDYERDEEENSLLDACVTIPETIMYGDIEATVEAIGYMAFADCETLREITIPETIIDISDYAFSGASYLEKVVIPETAHFDYFGTGVFEYTPVLGYFAENSADGEIILGDNVLFAYLGDEASYTVPEEIDFIADYCFFMSAVKEITLNDSIQYIDTFTFASCRNLKEITIPDSVHYIGEGAFADCTSLEKANLGESIEFIGLDAFRNTKVKEIYLGEYVYDVSGAFRECRYLESITVNENNENYYFEDDALYSHYEYYESFEDEEAGITTTETTLEYFLFTSDKTTFTVPEKVDVISSYAFYNCKNLDEIILTSPVGIWSYAFAYCDFENFDFSKVTYVGYHAFTGCKNISSANLSSAYSVEDSAFENCYDLEEVTFGPEICWIGGRAFANTAIKEISIGGDYTAIYENAFTNCSELERVNFNDGVYEIYWNIFTNCPSLERVYISKTVEYIDECAFTGCQDVTFELVKHSASADIMVEYAEDEDNDVTKYEFVEKLTFFERIEIFFTGLFNKISEFLFGWINWVYMYI